MIFAENIFSFWNNLFQVKVICVWPVSCLKKIMVILWMSETKPSEVLFQTKLLQSKSWKWVSYPPFWTSWTPVNHLDSTNTVVRSQPTNGLIGLPTTGSISLIPPGWGKFGVIKGPDLERLKVRIWNGYWDGASHTWQWSGGSIAGSLTDSISLWFLKWKN